MHIYKYEYKWIHTYIHTYCYIYIYIKIMLYIMWYIQSLGTLFCPTHIHIRANVSCVITIVLYIAYKRRNVGRIGFKYFQENITYAMRLKACVLKREKWKDCSFRNILSNTKIYFYVRKYRHEPFLPTKMTILCAMREYITYRRTLRVII